MAMIDRYRKSGGFLQLLMLLETCGPSKQEKFLEIVRSEDPRWADLLKTKMIDVQRIYSWPETTLSEIIGTLQDLTVATALHGASEEVKEKIHKQLTHSRRRKIDDLFETSAPSPGEIATTHMKIIETVRKMVQDGYLRLEKLDPELALEDDIEDKLSKATLLSDQSMSTPSSSTTESGIPNIFEVDEKPASLSFDGASDQQRNLELATLKKKLTELSKENATLRHDLSVAKNKLEQIKKIA